MSDEGARMIADAIHHLAAAIELHAQVQAGEYDDGEGEPVVERYMDGSLVRGTL